MNAWGWKCVWMWFCSGYRSHRSKCICGKTSSKIHRSLQCSNNERFSSINRHFNTREWWVFFLSPIYIMLRLTMRCDSDWFISVDIEVFIWPGEQINLGRFRFRLSFCFCFLSLICFIYGIRLACTVCLNECQFISMDYHLSKFNQIDGNFVVKRINQKLFRFLLT